MTTTSSPTAFSIGSILSDAWRLWCDNLAAILIITLVVQVPINIILALVPERVSGVDFRVYFQLTQLLMGLIGIVATIATAYLVEKRMAGEEMGEQAALRYAVTRWLPGIGTNILLGLCVAGLALLLVVPGVVYGVYWMFTMYAVALRGKSGMDAMRYSKSIVQGRWWRVVGYVFVIGILTTLVAAIGSSVWLFMPAHAVSDLISQTFVDALVSFFTVVWVVSFLRFEATRTMTGAESPAGS